MLRDPIRIQKIFNQIAPKYDLLNNLLSLGLHKLWKRKLLNYLLHTVGEKWADLCCGTGDLSITLADLVGSSGSIVGVDFSKEQISIARKKAARKDSLAIEWIKEDVLNSGLLQASFDGVVIAYGLRNVSSPEAGLREIKRLLKPFGRAGVLDFNRSAKGTFSFWFQRLYLRKEVVPIASCFGLLEEYSYL